MRIGLDALDGLGLAHLAAPHLYPPQIETLIAGKAIESVQKNIPLIRNNLLLLMSNRNYQSIMSREGKDKFRQEALAEVRAVQKKEGSPDVDDVLFTSFVVQ